MKGYVILAVLMTIVAAIVMNFISYANLGNRTEKGLIAQLEDNKNVYSNGTQRVLEIAQVPEMYADDLRRMVGEAIQNRYGAEGSRAAVQFLREQNPNLDPAMYKRVQDTIEIFRGDFEKSQRVLIDKRRVWETMLDNVWSGFWLSMAGYPKRPLSDFDVVISDKTKRAFETKRDEGITLKPSEK